MDDWMAKGVTLLIRNYFLVCTEMDYSLGGNVEK